jgi:branched-chain amino acid transport system substrate-binding protein
MKVGDSDFTPQMLRAKNAEADTILTFANTVEVANALKAGNKMGYKPRIISAWALANSTFPSLASGLSDGVMVMQTFTFVENKRPQAVALFKNLAEKYKDIKDPMEVTFPSFLGNSYDATHMVALAIKKAQSTEGSKLQSALENLGSYEGLVKTYSDPFSPSNHEALGPNDYLMTAWKGTRLELIG